MDLSELTDLVQRLFCRPTAIHGPYELRSGPEYVVPGILSRAELERPGDQTDTFELTIFHQIRGFAGQLWEQEVRSLLRFQALRHPALPEIVTGSFEAAERIAFTLTRIPGRPLDAGKWIELAAADPLEALDRLTMLIDGLSRINDARMMHRNLSLGALREGENDEIVISRFEMSTLIGNLVRRGPIGDSSRHWSVIRELYLVPPPNVELSRHLAFLAPETHELLFNNRPGVRREYFTTDVFGLGVLGWEWFCGAIPEVLPEAYEKVEEAPDGPAKAAALNELHAEMRRHLGRQHNHLPRPLIQVLLRMMRHSNQVRDTAFQVLSHLDRHWQGIRAYWEKETDETPRLVAFMPKESVTPLYQERKWLSHSPADPIGRDELRDFLTKELGDAKLVYSPDGALGYAIDDEQRLREARWVLVGARAVWFCAFYYDEYQRARGRGETHKDTLIIKYLSEHSRAKNLVNSKVFKKVSPLKLVAFRKGQDLTAERSGRPSWSPLTEELEAAERQRDEDRDFAESIDFLLSYQRAELDARKYAFKRVDGASGALGDATIQFDKARDDTWKHDNPLLSAYTSEKRRRPPLGLFLEEMETDKEDAFQIEEAQTSGPRFSRSSMVVDFVRRKDDLTAVVRPRDKVVAVPDSGWIRPSDDGGSFVSLLRQERAVSLLKFQSGLLRMLRTPWAIDLGRGRWEFSDEIKPGLHKKLQGEAPSVIQNMLSLQPFYALQGPPGTGKTLVAAVAIRRFLEHERGARVLVSAQSNYALDHLAKNLIQILPDTTLILRETSNPEKIAVDAVKKHTLVELTEQLTTKITDTLTWLLHPDQLDEDTRRRFQKNPPSRLPTPLNGVHSEIAERWLGLVRTNQIELADRINAGASVILATTSQAAMLGHGEDGHSDVFDWIIVEEAAKAWPTELIVPLVLGFRWSLIGDHRQLGAHRELELEQFLESLDGNRDPRIMRHYKLRKERMKALRLFGSIFETRRDDSGSDTPAVPLDRLKLQFRMHSTIAEPVGRTFYPVVPEKVDGTGLSLSFLDTQRPETDKDHGVTVPECIAGAPLVWIDTAGCAGFRDTRCWFNEGEVELVERLVALMTPAPLPSAQPPEDKGGLVVLTPYRMQRLRLAKRPLLKDRVHTVHSFQGREADRVIVSLVRSTPFGDTVQSNVGHVGRDEVANVLLSRAKRLLVLVGNLDLFGRHGGESWQNVAETVNLYGRVVKATALEEPWTG
ncbi:AAA domain-containing protein [Actinomadura mexicana]|uniref:Superfamily I DNA and/or RNA helicase n=1 Tax=Actinomadura mexicana TaxID=134959 RepID=A0A239C189_9ACTN|nr:AAA domain-containing protein [Actinomadura mexicana]SNS13133.1 Superfamily I DNA and/or RNA helicase [Actinomadura mexicana]